MSAGEWLTSSEFFAEAEADPEFRAAWERTALARAVSLAVLRYRSEHRLSQRGLATRPGIQPSAVARLDLGAHNPTIEMPRRLSRALDLRIALELRRERVRCTAGPTGGRARPPRARCRPRPA